MLRISIFPLSFIALHSYCYLPHWPTIIPFLVPYAPAHKSVCHPQPYHFRDLSTAQKSVIVLSIFPRPFVIPYVALSYLHILNSLDWPSAISCNAIRSWDRFWTTHDTPSSLSLSYFGISGSVHCRTFLSHDSAKSLKGGTNTKYAHYSFRCIPLVLFVITIPIKAQCHPLQSQFVFPSQSFISSSSQSFVTSSQSFVSRKHIILSINHHPETLFQHS